uniref:Uncharacterized protein n=1 Tax=viral metagenome TaxID=1070528 RepID=A0A6H1ZS79_9ZZZZ
MSNNQLLTINVVKDKRFLIFVYQVVHILNNQVVNSVEYFICAGGLIELTATFQNDNVNVGIIIVMIRFNIGFGFRPFKEFINNMKVRREK